MCVACKSLRDIRLAKHSINSRNSDAAILDLKRKLAQFSSSGERPLRQSRDKCAPRLTTKIVRTDTNLTYTMKYLVVLLVATIAVGVLAQYPFAETAFAGGRHIQASYSECGVWNNIGAQKGFQLDGCCRVDSSFPGNPWQSLCFRYNYPDNHTTEQIFVGNEGTSDDVVNGEPDEFLTPRCDWTVNSVEVFPPGAGSSFVGVKHEFLVGDLKVTKIESWDFKAKAASVSFTFEYPKDCCDFLENVTMPGPVSLTNIEVTFSVDPDQDYENHGTYQTNNWRVFGDWYAESVGSESCTTLAFGKCNYDSVVGHTNWLNCPLANYQEVTNNGGDRDDKTMAWSHFIDSIACGESKSVGFVVVWGDTPREAREAYKEAYSCYCPFDGTAAPDFDDDPEDYWPYECNCNCPEANTTKCTCNGGPPDHETMRRKRNVERRHHKTETEQCREDSLDTQCLLKKIRKAVKEQDVKLAKKLLDHHAIYNNPILKAILDRFMAKHG